MKIFIIAVMVCLPAFSCRKSNPGGQENITGKWELRKSEGGFAGTINYTPGNGNLVIFDNKKGYQFVNASVVVGAGTYDIKESAAPGNWILSLRYVYNGQTQITNDSVRLDGNQLVFFPAVSCCDMPATFYERLL